MLTKSVEVQEAQTRLRELLSWVANGTEVILMQGNKRVARLLPIREVATELRLPGLHPGAIALSADFDEPLPDLFWAGEA